MSIQVQFIFRVFVAVIHFSYAVLRMCLATHFFQFPLHLGFAVHILPMKKGCEHSFIGFRLYFVSFFFCYEHMAEQF